jgi:hypothetical protein
VQVTAGAVLAPVEEARNPGGDGVAERHDPDGGVADAAGRTAVTVNTAAGTARMA